MFEIPTSLTLNGKEFEIRNKGDFRVILDCFSVLNDRELTRQERVFSCLIIFFEDFESIDDTTQLGDLNVAVREMFKFFNCGQEDKSPKNSPRLIDWEKDSQMVASGINNVAKKEIRLEPYVHWWTFMGYYMAIGESTLSTVVGIRNKIAKGKKLEKYEQDFRRDNPQYFNIDLRKHDDSADDFEAELRRLWEG